MNSEKREYSITGWFETEFGSFIAQFSGSFVENNQGDIRGALEDIHGDSIIFGQLREGEIIFQKRYTNGPAVTAHISYHYEAVGNGDWEGEYDFIQGNIPMKGKSACRTNRIYPEVE